MSRSNKTANASAITQEPRYYRSMEACLVKHASLLSQVQLFDVQTSST